MRKPKISVLVILTITFAAFTLGFLLGRNQNQGAVSVELPQHMLTMPTQPPETVAQATEVTESITFPIDINHAEKEKLMALPGIGEVLAQRILDYREENGYFSSVEELLNVDGVGKKRLEEIWDLILIGGEQ